MSENNDQTSPDASPGEVSKKSGVRRVNNRPMYILFGVLGAFLLVMMMVAADRAAQQNAPGKGPKEGAGNTSMFANEIAGSLTEGVIPAAEPPTVPGLDAPQVNPDLPPTPPQNTGSQAERDDEAQRIRMAKLQMLEEAIKARTGIQSIAPRSSSDGGSSQPVRSRPQSRQDMINEIARVRQQIASNRSDDPTAAYQQRLAQIEGMRNGGSSNSGSMLLQTSANGDSNGYSQFDSKGGDRWQLGEQVQAPRSPYELRAGFVIPATLISGINSDLPSQIVAQVSQDVSDTATGSHLLIPQGSRLVGSYSNNVAYGQERVLIAWQRIIFPDGKALDIGSMPGADAAGYSGFHDQVNNHYLRIFGSAFLMSGVTAGVTSSQNNGNNSYRNNQRASDALSEALGQQLGQVMVEMIRKNMNIAPTLEIRPGYRFNVIVTKDMTFSKPYSSFDY
ncbi:TrbI/VirB10 family protein [Thiolapillus sp.]|uniref:TrbI/VirB10 family protein n=3 Tax=Thiolapillus sp. TaxID=2017437 RepID=UPI0025CC7545|nr:TrbI/VirB10 family protein [Thiolapillus sp.]